MRQITCSCDTGKPFNKCCGPFLDGAARPKTAKQLMRSRYTAYLLGGYGNYLLATWHPDSRIGLNAASLSAKTQEWTSLEICNSRQDNDWALVEFKARYQDSNGQLGLHHELSRFVRVAGTWYYIDGKVDESFKGH